LGDDLDAAEKNCRENTDEKKEGETVRFIVDSDGKMLD
jgi:hypothetical protein